MDAVGEPCFTMHCMMPSYLDRSYDIRDKLTRFMAIVVICKHFGNRCISFGPGMGCVVDLVPIHLY